MSEHEHSTPPGDQNRQNQWDSTPLVNTLNTEAETAQDVAFGDGYSFRLGAPPTTLIEIFPQAQTVRVTTSAARIELFRQPPPTIVPEGVVFMQQDSAAHVLRLTVAQSGKINLTVTPETPQKVTESSTTPVDVGQDIQEPFGAETGAINDSVPAAALSEHGTLPAEDSTEKQQRLNFSGRVGKPPHIRTTKSGTIVASFPVAIHNEDGTTTWRTVVAFDERAKQLQETVATGQTVQVIGYLHERETKTKGGKPKVIQEVYAAVVKLR